MKAVRWTVLLLIVLMGCRGQEQPQEAEIWKVLFDGETFTGWRGLGRDSVPGGHWIIEDGSIRKVASGTVPTAPDGQPLEGGDLMTVESYRDFELVFEWKVSPGANSGIKYNVSEAMSTASPPQNGPNRTAGGLYDLVPPGPAKELRPVGSFNEGRIVFREGHGEHWLNGVKILEFDLGTPAFDSVFALSKYLPVEGFAEQRAGHIVLQDHGDDVWFRNIKIREFAP